MNSPITNLDILFFITMALIIAVGFFLFLFGKKYFSLMSVKKNIFYKYVPLSIVIMSFMSLFYALNSYNKNRDEEIEILQNILNKTNREIGYLNETKITEIDSLNHYQKQLEYHISKLKKNIKITGDESEIIKKGSDIIEKISDEKERLKLYPELLNDSSITKNFLKQYISSGNTANFEFNCPTNVFSDYLDLSINFHDSSLVDSIACIYITFENRKDEKLYESVFRQSYKVQYGVNLFRVKNYLKDRNIKLEIGYFLKNEVVKAMPRFEKITCSSN